MQRRADRCIESMAFNGAASYYTVAEYEEGRAAAKEFSGTDRMAFLVISWALHAPPPEKLTLDWQPQHKPMAFRDAFRICDWDVYDRQMRELIGIA